MTIPNHDRAQQHDHQQPQGAQQPQSHNHQQPESLRPAGLPHQHPAQQTSDLDDWSSSTAMSDQAQRSGQLYLRLRNDGDRCSFVVAQRPLSYWGHKSQEAGSFRFRRCVGARSGCDRCAAGERPTLRHLLDVVDTDDLQRHALELSDAAYRPIAGLTGRFPPSRHVYEMTRHGRAGDTATTYSTIPVGPRTPQVEHAVQTTRPLDLEALSWGSRPPRRAPGSGGTCAPLPDAPF